MYRGGSGFRPGGRYSGHGGGSKGVCHQWRDTGFCRFGSRCVYTHSGPGVPGSNNNINTSNYGSRIQAGKDDTMRFIKHLSALPLGKLSAELTANASLWRKCWQERRSLDELTIRLMVEVLAKTPGSSSIDPPAMDYIVDVMDLFFKVNRSADDSILTAAKTALNLVERLLQFEWECSRDHVKSGITQIIIRAEGTLQKLFKEHREVASRLLEVVEELEKSWRIKMKVQAELTSPVDGAAQRLTYDNWKNANIEWLCNSRFFAPSCCPTMQVGKHGVYDSAEHYMETVLKLWVAMTFADGHAALAPHCRSRGQNGVGCNSSLWPVSRVTGRTDFRCRTSGCSLPVEFACRISSHDALCQDCAKRSVDHHLGEPGPGASTHLYDCTVKHINSEGLLFLVDFKSRNPPPNIHWRTTKRLSPPNLVAIVPVSDKYTKVNRKDKIKWGEIAYHGHNHGEEQRRNNGELAINISSICEFDPDLLEEGSFVVVIDCMSFVPEWIPVLKALESQRNARFPFEDGKYLNLCRDDPVSCHSALDTLSSSDFFSSNRSSVIEAMIYQSDLEPIREIRRDPYLLIRLVEKLVNLVNETTLDETQLVSFVDALRNPVHLTQGPPGTGKSYLGVVLVRALIIIRDLWTKKSATVGCPPILVLSYKNMAIDRFLVDLVKSEPVALSNSKLIRIGGSCNEPLLSQYSERNAFQSDLQVNEARRKVDMLNTLRDSVQSTLSGSIASFLAYKNTMFGDLDAKSRRKGANDATDFLMECIVKKHFFATADTGRQQIEHHEKKPEEVIKSLEFLEIDQLRKSHQVLRRLVEDPNGDAFVSALVKECSSCQTYHWGDILLMWLSGKKPLPICSYGNLEGNSCQKLAISHDVLFCEDHRCKFACRKQCVAPCLKYGARVCLLHSCKVDGCIAEKLPEKHTYCIVHACKRCVELGSVAQLARDWPPRNFCKDHPLCTFPSCSKFCSPDFIYRENHKILKCHATTKKGLPCKGQPMSLYKPYCRDHIHIYRLADNMVQEMDDSKSHSDSDGSFSDSMIDEHEETINLPNHVVFCKAITKRKQACKGQPIPGSMYCYDHTAPLIMQQDIHTISTTTEDDVADLIGVAIPLLVVRDGESDRNEANDANSSCELSVASDNSSVSYIVHETRLKQPFDEVDESEIDFEEGENLQHLRDVFEIRDDTSAEDAVSLLDDCDVKIRDDDDASFFSASAVHLACNPNSWTWKMPLEDRWQECHHLMEDLRFQMSKALLEIKQALALSRSELQLAKVRAKARVYESKSVIGGTMVGCIARLESIRATRPFAVVVEEASEVLEPLLFSCLSESTLKLEMIGDHRQLQPSVMSRFDYELCNKINISMFQRLIEAPIGHSIPSTVLSVQRRMRKNICDLTRNFYEDIVHIEDHNCCGLKVIDQSSPDHCNNWVSRNGMVQVSATGGREVPGIGPHVFLWTHGGKQGRARVGVSRINEEEAKRATAIAQYLVVCGVPRSSIAVLTPYKGQLLLIRDKMLKQQLLSRNPNELDTCRVSTVDRFQGDEEDIIICSLVVDENSKTGFVKLQNRMVVLLSRARLVIKTVIKIR